MNSARREEEEEEAGLVKAKKGLGPCLTMPVAVSSSKCDATLGARSRKLITEPLATTSLTTTPSQRIMVDGTLGQDFECRVTDNSRLGDRNWDELRSSISKLI